MSFILALWYHDADILSSHSAIRGHLLLVSAFGGTTSSFGSPMSRHAYDDVYRLELFFVEASGLGPLSHPIYETRNLIDLGRLIFPKPLPFV